MYPPSLPLNENEGLGLTFKTKRPLHAIAPKKKNKNLVPHLKN